jgi:hypothetical protein
MPNLEVDQKVIDALERRALQLWPQVPEAERKKMILEAFVKGGLKSIQ